jgi:hypothetical protein
MKRVLLSLATILLSAHFFSILGYTGPNELKPDSKIDWETSFEDAKARAQREGKPILLLHLFGRFDEEFC